MLAENGNVSARCWLTVSVQRSNNMRSVCIITILLLVFSVNSISYSMEKTTKQELGNKKIIVIYNGNPLQFTKDPVIINDRVFVPLRDLAEQMGATIEWDNYSVLISKDGYEARVNIGSDTVFTSDRQFFYLDRIPILICARTFIPIRAINPILNTDTKWDNASKTVTITSDSYAGSISVTDKYYRLYEPLLGPRERPSLEEAQQFALDNGQIVHVEYSRYVNPQFGIGEDTLVYGYDSTGREKAIWFNIHTYWETIEVAGSVFLDEGITKEEVVDFLIKKEGFARDDILDIYLAILIPQVAWHIVVNHNDSVICYLIDFKTGELVPFRENPFRITQYPL